MNEPNPNALVVVTGGGGFIGGHLVAELRRRGCLRIRAVDIKPLGEWYQRFDDVENLTLDLSSMDACAVAARGAARVFNLAADMGGMGFIEQNKALCMLTVLINTHMLMASRDAGVERFFFSSSACVYAAEKQTGAARKASLNKLAAEVNKDADSAKDSAKVKTMAAAIKDLAAATK